MKTTYYHPKQIVMRSQADRAVRDLVYAVTIPTDKRWDKFGPRWFIRRMDFWNYYGLTNIDHNCIGSPRRYWMGGTCGNVFGPFFRFEDAVARLAEMRIDLEMNSSFGTLFNGL